MSRINTLDELKLVRERLKYQALIQEQRINAEVNTVKYNITMAIREAVVQFGQKILVSTVVKLMRKK